VLAHVNIGKVAGGFRSAVHGVVLRGCDGEVVFGVIALQSGDVGNAHAAGEERIFAVGLLSAAPAGITEDVEIGRPEVQASHDAGVAFARVLHVLDASLNTNLRRHGANSRRIERGGKPDALRILGHTLVDDSVEGFAPPFVCRNFEPRHCRGIVLHLRSLLRKSHAAYQVGGPLPG